VPAAVQPANASARVRAQAARAVAAVAAHGRSLDAVLPSLSAGTPQERGLVRALAFDTVRWHIRLDAMLARLLKQPGQDIAPEVRALALVGLCQLAYTSIPPHAAVDETVNAARVLGQPRAAGLINAILRRWQRERATIEAAVDRDDAIRSAHPRWLFDALTTDWAERTAAILEANNQRPPFWIRVNRRRSNVRDYRAALDSAGIVVVLELLEGHALQLDRAVDVADLPGFASGLVSVQDAAAQLAGCLVAPRPGERVLDACAAPGGKSGHLLELQPELAELVAVDVSHERLRRVADNLQRLGSAATLIAADAARPADWWDGRPFDRILLDVPCSATGVIRRHPDIKLLRRAEDIPALAARQRELLRALWPLLAPGGRLVYASCSALRQETVFVVREFLQDHADAGDETASVWSGLPPAVSRPDEPGMRIPAGTDGMDGFYYACMHKHR
jgi:16S rRNA (cytosine967-C5)-methyltransferase